MPQMQPFAEHTVTLGETVDGLKARVIHHPRMAEVHHHVFWVGAWREQAVKILTGGEEQRAV
jgi:hypothetical protein